MLALQRQRKIRQSLAVNGSVRTAELADELDVTEETIRRDFERLEAEGVLVRTHGGAVRLDLSNRDFPFRERVEQNAGGKARIARAALAHIKEGATVFFDASTTVLQVAALLPEKPLTVLTNALQTASALAEKSGVTVFVLGGQLSPASLSCTGWAAGQGIDQHRIDAAFISCKGVDTAFGVSEAAEEHARVKRHAVQRAAATYLLADHTKAGVVSSFFFAKNSEIDFWITDRELPPGVFDSVSSQGVRVEVAK